MIEQTDWGAKVQSFSVFFLSVCLGLGENVILSMDCNDVNDGRKD